jgi:glycosyltransferase involved in cell wall biosynthesis
MNIEENLRIQYILKVRQLINGKNKGMDKNKNKCEVIDSTFSPKESQKKLKIAYVLNHARVCGGVKILLEHTNYLVDRGHQVVIICRDEKPNWRNVKANFIQVPHHMGFLEAMPDVDVIVCTTADQVPECYSIQKAPVILFEQGDTYIFEFDTLNNDSQTYFKELWSYPIPIVGVSKILIDTLYQNFGRRGQVLKNALDKRYFFPRTHHSIGKPRILFVGQENNTFKGIKVIREALELVRKSGKDFDEVWVSQQTPKSHFNGTLVINPSQQNLGNIYRSCDIFVSGSYYESFSLPPLEAMTCGCAVVSTNNLGIQEYGIDGNNCLLGEVGKPESLAKHIIDLIDNYDKRMKLVENGYKTAQKFNWEEIIPEWEKYLYGTIELWDKFKQMSSKCSLHIEILPKGLSLEEANKRIQYIQQHIDKDWCLYLVEGESLDEQDIEQIKRILALGLDIPFGFQVIYSDDVPHHQIIRAEQRLYKRGRLSNSSENIYLLPIKIFGGTESYFLFPWLADIRNLYINQCFDEIISLVQSNFSTMLEKEKLVAIKWFMLALLELDRKIEVVNLAKQAIKWDITYSDILYLLGYTCLKLENKVISNKFFQLAKRIGPATHYPETFLEFSEMYLSDYN